MSRPPTPIAERFWPKVDKRGADECWMWLAAVNKFSGYGQIFNGKTMSAAHRVAYELGVGPIPARMTIDHTCNVRLCVNPAHLRPCTTQANTQAAKERRETCRRGHPIAENLYVSPRGERRCRACNTGRHREYAARRAAAYERPTKNT
jgi:hypothetical protein